ncbi:ileal sodium/bile acid cotransporter-like [Ptychodera flava]|uniref:ileal sodium/bile acid cotransporter-like n=1 Tax=Ptychodera flava TaxID=63121 RepID=UPI00396A5FB6
MMDFYKLNNTVNITNEELTTSLTTEQVITSLLTTYLPINNTVRILSEKITTSLTTTEQMMTTVNGAQVITTVNWTQMVTNANWTQMVTNANWTNSTESAGVVPGIPPHILTLMKLDQYLTYMTVIIIMIGMGGATDIPGIKKSLRRPWGIIICALTQFVLLPLFAYGLALLSKMSPSYAIGLLVQCSSPGGTASNILSYFADGNMSLSVCLTTFSTLLAVGFMPLNLFLYGRTWTDAADVAIPYMTVVISLAMTLIPAAFGLLLKYKIPKYITRITQVCSVIGTITIFVGIGIRAYIQPATFRNSWEIWLLVACLPLTGLTVGFIASSVICQPCTNRRTIGIETGCQNIALALSVINTSFPPSTQRSMMQVISSLYGPVMAVELLSIIGIFRVLYHSGHCRRCDDGRIVRDDAEELRYDSIPAKLKFEEANGMNRTSNV